ncbi:hypothetical protein I5535_21205 [Rhodobacteraceae bacterium F11138]|nr:hypothetical protein [Rhodobacteraceae bacterium F11138]
MTTPPSHLSAWRRMAKGGDLVLPALETETDFAPLVVFDVEPPSPTEAAGPVASRVEIMAGAVAVDLPPAKSLIAM